MLLLSSRGIGFLNFSGVTMRILPAVEARGFNGFIHLIDNVTNHIEYSRLVFFLFMPFMLCCSSV